MSYIKTRTLCLFLLSISLSGLFCSGQVRAVAEDIKVLVEANDAFAFRLYADMASQEGNIIVSPFSVSMAFAMASVGASGQTLTEMHDTLGLSPIAPHVHHTFCRLRQEIGGSLKNGAVTLRMANALWLQSEIITKDAFTNTLVREYCANVKKSDFITHPDLAVSQINRWVNEATYGRIPMIMGPDSVSPLTRFILLNAIYFKGSWSSMFLPRNTKPTSFYMTPESNVKVPMMCQTQSFKMAEADDVAILELPYKGGGFSMVLLLPNKRDGLEALEKMLNRERVNLWLRELRSQEVQVFLPRFTFEKRTSLNQTLSRLGMPRAFSAGQADFSFVSDEKPLYLNFAFHHAGIMVDEEGTTAWAVTAAGGETLGADPLPKLFRADHPFVFMIIENRTGSILFLGRVINPGNPSEHR
jgi:serpin B